MSSPNESSTNVFFIPTDIINEIAKYTIPDDYEKLKKMEQILKNRNDFYICCLRSEYEKILKDESQKTTDNLKDNFLISNDSINEIIKYTIPDDYEKLKKLEKILKNKSNFCMDCLQFENSIFICNFCKKYTCKYNECYSCKLLSCHDCNKINQQCNNCVYYCEKCAINSIYTCYNCYDNIICNKCNLNCFSCFTPFCRHCMRDSFIDCYRCCKTICNDCINRCSNCDFPFCELCITDDDVCLFCDEEN